MKKNQKKLLAVLGAFLMVSFLVSVPMGSLTNGSRGRGTPIAHIGKTAIYADERRQSDIELRLLDETQYLDLEHRQFLPATMLAGMTIGQDLRAHHDLFLLLIKAAEQRGIDVPMDVVDTFMHDKLFSAPTDEVSRNAFRHILMIKVLREQLDSDIKFSQPQWKHMYADRERKIRLNLVQFSASAAEHLAPVPTTQQVEALYDTYKSTPPGTPSTQPSGEDLAFSYLVPDRVKLQYVTIPRDQVLLAAREAHRDPKDAPDAVPYDLSVKAREYYLQHQSEFATPPATAPATTPATAPAIAASQPTTGPTTVAATQPAAPATQAAAPTPTTRPFADVQDQILATLLKSEADELQQKVNDAVTADMTHAALAAATGPAATQAAATQPAATHATLTPPASAPAVALAASTQPATQPDAVGTADLEAIRLDILSRFKVAIETTQVGQWQDAKALSALSGIGTSMADRVPFPEYVLTSAFGAPAADGALQPVLRPMQPGAVLTDFQQNAYVFRLLDVSKAHAPDLASIAAQVAEDARTRTAYALAVAQARKFVDAAQRRGFSQAAFDQGHSVTSTGVFNPAESEGMPNFSAGPQSVGVLKAKTLEMLANASAQNPMPIAVAPMPADRIVVVAQLADVVVSQEQMSTEQMNASRSVLSSPVADALASDYFGYDAVVKRLEYTQENGEK